MRPSLYIISLVECAVWHNDGKTKAEPTLAHAETVTHLRKPIFDSGRPIFQSGNTLMKGIDIPRQMSVILDQLFKSRENIQQTAQTLTEYGAAVKAEGLARPTLVPGQAGVFPRLRGEIFCGGQKSLVQCATLGDIGSSFGNAILDILQQSNLQYLNDEAFGLLDQFYRSMTLGMTDALIDTIELEPLVQTLEQIYKKLISDNINFLQPKDNPDPDAPGALLPGKQNILTSTHEHLLNNLAFDSLDRMALNEAKLRGVMDRIDDFVTCDAFPGCRQRRQSQNLQGSQNASGESVLRALIRSAEEAGTTLPKNVYVVGFVESCKKQKGCVSSYRDMVPEIFDGLYELELYSETEVVYAKRIIDSGDEHAIMKWQALYKDALPELYLWMKSSSKSPGEYELAITAEIPLSSRKHSLVGSKPPYALLSSSCPHLDPVSCGGSSHWFLQTHSTYGCRYGLKHQDLCIYPTKVDILPAQVDDLIPITVDA